MSNSPLDIDFAALESGEMGEQDAAIAMQKLINSGTWGLQGSYGRSMMDAIKSGSCMLGKTSARDAYGNYIPGRDEVEPGTKGSYAFVADRMGEDYAAMIAEVN